MGKKLENIFRKDLRDSMKEGHLRGRVSSLGSRELLVGGKS